MPTAAVSITLTVGADLLLAHGTASRFVNKITFTIRPEDWDDPLAIVVMAVDNMVHDGLRTAGISLTITSPDPDYAAIGHAGLDVAIHDNDLPPSPPPPPPPGSVLEPGGKAEWGAMSGKGEAVLLRSSSEVASIEKTPHGLLVTWHDNTDTLLSGARTIAFQEGHLVFDGASAGARALRAYQAIQGFEPPPEAVAHTAALLMQGIPMIAVTNSLLATPEWLSRAAGLAPGQQISLIYEAVIGYSPPPDAMAYLSWSLSVGVSLGDLAAMLIDTPEAAAFSNLRNPNGAWVMNPIGSEIVRAFDAVLDSVPDPATLTRWSLLIGNGLQTVDGLYADLMSTELFQARHAGQSNAAFVMSAYEQALERPPSEGEFNWNFNLLEQGTASRLAVLRSLGAAQTTIGHAPGDATQVQDRFYAPSQAAGEVLGRGESLRDIAISQAGHAVTIRAASELGSLHVAPDGLLLRWLDGEAFRLAPVEELMTADGRLEFDGAARSAVVARIYEATIGFGISGWHNATFGTWLDGGTTLGDLTRTFLNTPESKGHLAGLDQTGLMIRIYTSIFGFAPEPGALDYLTWSLDNGVPLADLTVWLAGLPEAAQAFEARHPTGIWTPDLAGAAVVRAYDAMLNMAPDPLSLTIWKSAIASDPGLLHILYATLMETDIHVALYDGLGDEAWVAGHYRAALERDATPAELAHSTGLVASGAVSRLAMAVAIGELQPLPDVPLFAVPDLDFL